MALKSVEVPFYRWGRIVLSLPFTNWTQLSLTSYSLALYLSWFQYRFDVSRQGPMEVSLQRHATHWRSLWAGDVVMKQETLTA